MKSYIKFALLGISAGAAINLFSTDTLLPVRLEIIHDQIIHGFIQEMERCHDEMLATVYSLELRESQIEKRGNNFKEILMKTFQEFQVTLADSNIILEFLDEAARKIDEVNCKISDALNNYINKFIDMVKVRPVSTRAEYVTYAKASLLKFYDQMELILQEEQLSNYQTTFLRLLYKLHMHDLITNL